MTADECLTGPSSQLSARRLTFESFRDLQAIKQIFVGGGAAVQGGRFLMEPCFSHERVASVHPCGARH
jgi:hypothetical protein